MDCTHEACNDEGGEGSDRAGILMFLDGSKDPCLRRDFGVFTGSHGQAV